jgi:hypothetical protein
VSDADYIAASKQLGETYALDPTYGGEIVGKPMPATDVKVQSADIIVEEVYTDFKEEGATFYTLIHSNDPEKTADWLYAEFRDLATSTVPNTYRDALVTPDILFDRLIQSELDGIVGSLIAMVVVLVLMSVCMYFIMRSSLMNRIKEVGIYRAIGVSKKNLIFKFFVEAIVLTGMTVLVGYLISSAFIYVCFGMSSLTETIFFYPIWLAGVDLLLLCVISLFFGTVPIISLLRRTPSEILAKYDI